MKRTDVLIVGGGQAGLAMSRCLSDLGIDHIVLERGRVAERWRSERWDSLRLLTPNWQSRLPGWSYRGPAPHGYMGRSDVVAYLGDYARSFCAPVEVETAVSSVRSIGSGYVVDTDRGAWLAANVVVATGYADRPAVPAAANHLSPDIVQVTPPLYRSPDRLPDGGVLVVGASATGVQLAEEIQCSGREVTLAVGRHVRVPRSYRGRDILWWLEVMGILDQGLHDLPAPEISFGQPSLQLVGRDAARPLDLGTLQASGVRLTGRLVGAENGRVFLADDLQRHVIAADRKLARLLGRIDRFVVRSGLFSHLPAGSPILPQRPPRAPTEVDLRAAGIRTVLWATGFRRSYPWLRVPVLDRAGEIRHRQGKTSEPGLYVLGMHFQRRRRSSFLDGVGDDARELAGDIALHLGARCNAGRRRWGRATSSSASPVEACSGRRAIA